MHLFYFIYIANTKIKKSNNTKSIPTKHKKNVYTGFNKKITNNKEDNKENAYTNSIKKINTSIINIEEGEEESELALKLNELEYKEWALSLKERELNLREREVKIREIELSITEREYKLKSIK